MTITSVPEHKVGTLNTFSPVVSRTSSFSLEDWADIAIATKVKALYVRKGKTAFMPLRKYQQRRRGRKL